MNYLNLLASFSSEAVNNWALWCFTILIAGLIFFGIGLFLGHRHWNRFKVITLNLERNCDKRYQVLAEKRDAYHAISQSLDSTE